jgi:hypothetical protein
MMQQPKVIADSWYAKYLGDFAISLDDLIQQKCPKWLSQLAIRSGLVRGILFYRFGRSYEFLVTVCDVPGSWVVLFLQAWFGGRGRRVILLEFIRSQPSGFLYQLIYPVWFRFVAKPAVQRAMQIGHVLTKWEVDYYASMFDINKDRFQSILWPLRAPYEKLPAYDNKSDTKMVLSSGRGSCEWEALFRAALEREWSITVVCTKRDLRHIRRLNRCVGARVFCDISSEKHQILLRSASVFVMSMRERLGSSGHVRLANAIRTGVPVVATRIKALEDYIEDGETGLFVEPADWLGLREAIENLLADPIKCEYLRTMAFERAGEWTTEQYMVSVTKLVKNTVLS